MPDLISSTFSFQLANRLYESIGVARAVPLRSLRITLEMPRGGRCENTPVHGMSIVKRLQGPLISWFWADSENHQGCNIAPSLQKYVNEEIQFIRQWRKWNGQKGHKCPESLLYSGIDFHFEMEFSFSHCCFAVLKGNCISSSNATHLEKYKKYVIDIIYIHQ